MLKFFQLLLEILFPSTCLICDCPTPPPIHFFSFYKISLETFFCSKCRKEISISPNVFCRRCARVISVNKDGCSCSREYCYIDEVRPLHFYHGIIRTVVLRMKKDKKQILTRAIAKLYFSERHTELEQFRPDGIVAVPMNWQRFMARGGINAPATIAKELSRELGIPCWSNHIKRKRSTLPQTVIKWDERFLNVYNAFEISEKKNRFRKIFRFVILKALKNTWVIFPKQQNRFQQIEKKVIYFVKKTLPSVDGIFQDKRIVIVDDVFTTGSTTNEIARILKEAGASAVMVIVIARAGLGKDKMRNI